MNTNELNQNSKTVEELQSTIEQLRQSLRDALVGAELSQKAADRERERANALEARLYNKPSTEVGRTEEERAGFDCLQREINRYNLEGLFRLFTDLGDPKYWADDIAKISMLLSEYVTILSDERDKQEFADAFHTLKVLYNTFIDMEELAVRHFDVLFVAPQQPIESIE